MDTEPADERDSDDQDLTDFDIGFQAQLDGKPFDYQKSQAWCDGYNAALESKPKP